MPAAITLTNIKALGNQEQDIYLQDIVKFRAAEDHQGTVIFTKNSIDEDGKNQSNCGFADEKAMEFSETPKQVVEKIRTLKLAPDNFIELHDKRGAFGFNLSYVGEITNTSQGAEVKVVVKLPLLVTFHTSESKEEIYALHDKVLQNSYAAYIKENTLKAWAINNPNQIIHPPRTEKTTFSPN